MGRAWARFARPRIEPGRDVPAQLRERGIEARDLPLVVMTHLHQDHASGMSEFPNSTFVISAAEWHAATTDPRPLLRGYRPAHYDYVFDYRTLSYEGPSIASYSTFGRTFDLFGDGSVRLAFTPGHSAGHQCVIAHLRDRDFVIAGDAIYTHGQLERRAGAAPPPRPPHLAPLAPGAGALPSLLSPGRDRARPRPGALADAGHEVRVSGGQRARG